MPGVTEWKTSRQLFLGSSQWGGASEGMARSEFVPSRDQKDFFFEVRTEVIIHGRTKPGASVKFGDKEIPLAPDGTFSLHYKLPEGVLPLDFMATSQDKIRQIQFESSVVRTKSVYKKKESR